jgi:hypothetical protein
MFMGIRKRFGETIFVYAHSYHSDDFNFGVIDTDH